jgi:Holliday junction DNA helicase RuvA
VIGHLRGQLLRKHTQDLLVEVQGVGYRVSIPLSTYYQLGEPGSEVALHVYTHVREDALALYGFLTPLEQTLFERLMAVSGVGPKLALGILSGIETDELVAALAAADLARLTRIPGVGRKTAERLVVELKDRMKDLAADAAPAAAPTAGVLRDDVASALANLGYARAESDRALDRAVQAHPAARFEELLRETLRLLSGAR